jgi:small subunit ribosomal protein S19e
LKQLEEAGLVSTVKAKGRVVTPEGRKMVDLLSAEVKKELEKANPELKKY